MSVVVKGKVTVKVHGVLKQKQLSGNWAVLYDGGGKNNQPPCITLYDTIDLATPLHTIILEQLKFPDKSYQHQEPFLVVSIKKDKHQFHFEDTETKEEWIHSFCHVSTDLWKQWASRKESSETESDSFRDMSDNLLYDSFTAAPTFKVSVNPTPASERNKVKGHYLLSPTTDTLKLLEIDTSKCLFEWSYKQIRKYGKSSTLFKMEVGRSCPTGPGEFAFFTPDGLALSEAIAMQTRLAFNQSYKPPQEQAASSAPAENTDYAESQTSDQATSDISAQQPPPPAAAAAAAATPQRRETRNSAVNESHRSQANSAASVGSKHEPPKPTPRTSINKAKKERGSMNGMSEAPSSTSSDTKIYATPSGLTAPLDSSLKHELQNKVHSQLSDTSQASQIEDDPASDNARNSMSSHGSSESLKDKRKSDRERKKLEREQKATEAKRKKQLEKEQKEREKELKEQRERETKEEKERQKKLKKESKSREKLKSKKSLEASVSVPEPCADGNIYDEPGELLKDQQATEPVPVDSDYCEAGDVIPALQQPSKASSAEAATEVSNVYATPFKPKHSWKTQARPESDHVHNEDYDAIKQACQSQPSSQRPAYSPPSHALPGAEDVDDTYNHLGAFKPLIPAAENIYGMASATDTVEPYRTAAATPSVVENEYEEASAVCTSLSSKLEAAQVREDRGKTEAPQRYTMNIRVASGGGDYADISDT